MGNQMGNAATLTEKSNEVWDITIDPEAEEDVTTYYYKLAITKEGTFEFTESTKKNSGGFCEQTTVYKGTYTIAEGQIRAQSSAKDIETDISPIGDENATHEQTEQLGVPDNTSFVWVIDSGDWSLTPQGFKGHKLERRAFSFQF